MKIFYNLILNVEKKRNERLLLNLRLFIFDIRNFI